MQHNFVKLIPNKLEDNILYISLDYGTAVHKCCCGCGNEVVTPLSPIDWKLTFDGDTVSLYPSIGNWIFKCKSHYWIRNNKIIWAEKWSDEKIKLNRLQDRLTKEKYYSNKKIVSAKQISEIKNQSGVEKTLIKMFVWLKNNHK